MTALQEAFETHDAHFDDYEQKVDWMALSTEDDIAMMDELVARSPLVDPHEHLEIVVSFNEALTEAMRQFHDRNLEIFQMIEYTDTDTDTDGEDEDEDDHDEWYPVPPVHMSAAT